MQQKPIKNTVQVLNKQNSVLRKSRKEKIFSGRNLSILSVIVFFLIWQIVGKSVNNPILFPPPSAVIVAFWDLISTGELFKAFLISLGDLGAGFALAVIIGLSIGVLMGRSEKIERILTPYVSFMNSTPGIALTPLIIIWFGIQFEARVFMVLLLALWSIVINTTTGIQNVNKVMGEVGTVFHLSQRQFLFWISIPNAMPYIYAGLRIGLGKGIIGMMISEMEMQMTGLGGLVMSYGNQFKTDYLLAGVITSSIFGVIAVTILAWSQRRFFPWIRGVSGKNED